MGCGCSCGGRCMAGVDPELRAVATGSMAGLDGGPGVGMGTLAGECDALIKFATPDTVNALRLRLNPEFWTTDAAVKACAALSAEERDAWARFLRSWQYQDDPDWWNASSLFDQACGMSRELEGWRVSLQGRCKQSGPLTVPGPSSEFPSAIKWGAAALIVVALVVGVRTVVR